MKKGIYFFIIAIIFSSCYAVRAYRFRKFELKDLDKFRASTIEKSNTPFHFYNTENSNDELKGYLDSNLQNSKTYAFLVIKNDSILYEKYFDDYDSTNIFPSFSVAKSFVGTLAQIAHQEGKIRSFSESVTVYLPWLLKKDVRWKDVTVQNVLDMRTGVKSSEKYDSPFSDVIQLGFTNNLSKRLRRLKIDSPLEKFVYQSINTQILAAVIEAATKEKLQDYLYKKLWQPLGMESSATWQTDAKGTARAFCCLNATMKDFAKLGRLYLRYGDWDGTPVLSKKWVQNIFNPDTMRAYQGYKNHWWSSRVIRRFSNLPEAESFVKEEKSNWYTGRTMRGGKIYYSAYKNLPAVFAQGMLGQYIYINPGKNLIIIRMGHSWSHPRMYAQKFIEQVAEMIE